ncbi:MAG TPA: S41 family peptidase [Chloroflexia bacterium]|nr:S41 family peptidase [Chloroflexia bacterium]
MDEIKPVDSQANPAVPVEPVITTYSPNGNNKQNYSPNPGNSRLARLAPFLSGFIIFLAAFLGGILFTVYMIRTPLSGTPLEAVQKPVLEMSGIPADAHREWLALQQAIRYTDTYFYEQNKIDHKKMLYAAAENAIASLGDRFTAFNPPEVAKANSDFISGKFVGIGVTPEIKDGKYVIKKLVDDSPAQKAGIKEGDILTAIDGQPVPPNITDASTISDKLRGAVDSKLKVTFQRPSDNNRETEYELTRTELILPSVDARLLPNNIAYIEMTRVFGENTMTEFDKKVGEISKQNPSGYILDLRGNLGGSVETARQLLGRFLDGGIAYYEDAPSQGVHMRPVDVETSPTIKLYDKPLVVLVDGNSASASEITAGALHDRKRATLIGEKTYGKGSAQRVIQLEGNSALRVTFEHWFTPDKVNLYDTKGIEPDIKVVPTDTQKKLNQDPQLDQALDFLSKNIAKQ